MLEQKTQQKSSHFPSRLQQAIRTGRSRSLWHLQSYLSGHPRGHQRCRRTESSRHRLPGRASTRTRADPAANAKPRGREGRKLRGAECHQRKCFPKLANLHGLSDGGNRRAPRTPQATGNAGNSNTQTWVQLALLRASAPRPPLRASLGGGPAC